MDGMAAPHPTRRVRPCPICGGDCAAFPDAAVHDTYPFLTAAHKARPPAPAKPGRPKGKRRPAEDRARHLQEDR